MKVSKMLNDTHVLELLPAYALGALEADETQLVTEHVTGCYLCRKELQSFQEVADQFSLMLPEARPSHALRGRLMEQIKTPSPMAKQPARAERWRRPARWLPAGLVAGLLLIFFLGLSNFLLWQRLNNLEVLTGPLGMRAITLQNTPAARGASGFVIMGADGNNGVLVVDKLPPLDATREYQAWLVRDGKYTNSVVFAVDESGYRGARLTAPESLLTYSSLEITVEPAGGSVSPTGEAVLKGSLFNP